MGSLSLRMCFWKTIYLLILTYNQINVCRNLGMKEKAQIFFILLFMYLFLLLWFNLFWGPPIGQEPMCLAYTPIFAPLTVIAQSKLCFIYLYFHGKAIDQWLLDFNCTLAYTAKIFQSEATEQTLYSHTRTHETAHSSLAPLQKTISGEVFQQLLLIAQRSNLRKHSLIFIVCVWNTLWDLFLLKAIACCTTGLFVL